MAEYREIVGHPGYRVGDDGTVWSQKRQGGRSIKPGDPWRLMKLTLTSHGYHVVGLRAGRANVNLHYVHELVLTTFVGPRPVGMECCHFDGTRTNNACGNLRWDTNKANHEDMARHGRKAGRKPKAQLIPEKQL